MSGSIPVEWSTLTTLQTLDLEPLSGYHGLNGTIPSEWSTLLGLQYFSLADAPTITGALWLMRLDQFSVLAEWS